MRRQVAQPTCRYGHVLVAPYMISVPPPDTTRDLSMDLAEHTPYQTRSQFRTSHTARRVHTCKPVMKVPPSSFSRPGCGTCYQQNLSLQYRTLRSKCGANAKQMRSKCAANAQQMRSIRENRKTSSFFFSGFSGFTAGFFGSCSSRVSTGHSLLEFDMPVLDIA